MMFDNMGRNPHICNINQNNNIMRTKLDNLRLEVKEGIVELLTKIYLKHYEVLPKWSEGEEIVIEDSELGHSICLTDYEVTENGYIAEHHTIENFIVTCDSNLYFVWGEGCNERCWDEENTDALVGLYDYLYRFWNKIK